MRDVNPRVVIVGAGFGGSQAAKKTTSVPTLCQAPVTMTFFAAHLGPSLSSGWITPKEKFARRWQKMRADSNR